MFRIFATALLMLASCAAPIEHGGVDERLSHWNSDVKRFLHMHRSEAELRDWIEKLEPADTRRIFYTQNRVMKLIGLQLNLTTP